MRRLSLLNLFIVNACRGGFEGAPPTISITSGPSASTTERDATFTFEATDWMGTAISEFLCSVDQAQPQPCASPHGATGLRGSDHLFSVSAVDRSGRVSLPSTHAWTIRDGGADQSFGTDGEVRVNVCPPSHPSLTAAADLLIEADGSMVVAGSCEDRFMIARLTPDGSLDTSFGDSGRSIISFTADWDHAHRVAPLPGVGYLLAGTVGETATVFGRDLGVAAFHTDGTLASAQFNAPQGALQHDSGALDRFGDLKVIDAEIWLSGTSGVGGVSYRPNLVKLDSSGQVSSSDYFDLPNSIVDNVFHWSGGFSVLDDGSLLLGDWLGCAVAKINATGALDTSFGANGSASIGLAMVEMESAGCSCAPVVLHSGTIVVGGQLVGADGDEDLILVGYDATGDLDHDFGELDSHTIVPGSAMRANDVDCLRLLLQPDGKILMFGHRPNWSGQSTDADMALFRFLADGTRDPTFGDNGRVLLNPGWQQVAGGSIVLVDDLLYLTARVSDGDTSESEVFVTRYELTF